MDGNHAFGRANDADVVRIGEEALVRLKEVLDRAQSLVLPQGEEHGHERTALLAAFFWMT